MVAVVQQIGGGAAVVPHGVRVFDGGAPAVGEVLGCDLMLRAVQNVALGGCDLGVVPDTVIGILVVHAEQGNAALGTVPGGLSRCPVDRFAFAVILIQLEGRAVQGMTVLRVHLLNGEEVIVIVAVIAADAAGNGIGNRGLRKFLLFHRHTGAVFGLQNGALVGEQGLFCLCTRERFFALQILHTVSAGFGFMRSQLDGIGQLDRREVGDVLVDGPDKLVLGRIVYYLETAVSCTYCLVIAKVPSVFVLIVINHGQLLAADRQALDANKVKLLTDGIGHRRTGANGVEDVVFDAIEDSVKLFIIDVLGDWSIRYANICTGVVANSSQCVHQLIAIILRSHGSVIYPCSIHIDRIAMILFSHGSILCVRFVNSAVNAAGMHQLIVLSVRIQATLDVVIFAKNAIRQSSTLCLRLVAADALISVVTDIISQLHIILAVIRFDNFGNVSQILIPGTIGHLVDVPDLVGISRCTGLIFVIRQIISAPVPLISTIRVVIPGIVLIMQAVDGITDAIGIGVQISLTVNAIGFQAIELGLTIDILAIFTFLGELIGMSVGNQNDILSIIGNLCVFGKHLIGFDQTGLNIGAVQPTNVFVTYCVFKVFRIRYLFQITDNDCCSAKGNHTDFQCGFFQLLLCKQLGHQLLRSCRGCVAAL